MKTFFALIIVLTSFAAPAAQATSFALDVFLTEKDSIPKVFLLGEYEKEFEQLTLNHQTLLLTACDDDMNLAFGKWMSMVQEMEAFSTLVGYDLDGIKMWLNVFWDKNGSVSHIAYFLKPNSKNVDTMKLSRFMKEFVNHYNFPLTYNQKFSHYGTANFPTRPKRVKKDKPVIQNRVSADSAKSGE